jgi:hypothetical protein
LIAKVKNTWQFNVIILGGSWHGHHFGQQKTHVIGVNDYNAINNVLKIVLHVATNNLTM